MSSFAVQQGRGGPVAKRERSVPPPSQHQPAATRVASFTKATGGSRAVSTARGATSATAAGSGATASNPPLVCSTCAADASGLASTVQRYEDAFDAVRAALYDGVLRHQSPDDTVNGILRAIGLENVDQIRLIELAWSSDASA